MSLQAVIFTLARTIDWSLDAAGCPHPDSQTSGTCRATKRLQRFVSARQAWGAERLAPTARVGGRGGGLPALIVQGRCRRGPRAGLGCPLLLARGRCGRPWIEHLDVVGRRGRPIRIADA